MNVTDLLKDSPGLIDKIKDIGVPQDKIGSLGSAIGEQLGGGLDLGDLLGGLDVNSFMSKMNVQDLAQQVGISPDVVQNALALIGPKIEQFVPGGLAGLAGKFFGK